MGNMGIGSWPARRVRMSPNRTAIVPDGREWTYRQHERSARLADALAGMSCWRCRRQPASLPSQTTMPGPSDFLVVSGFQLAQGGDGVVGEGRDE
jgi:hypothetical protein